MKRYPYRQAEFFLDTTPLNNQENKQVTIKKPEVKRKYKPKPTTQSWLVNIEKFPQDIEIENKPESLKKTNKLEKPLLAQQLLLDKNLSPNQNDEQEGMLVDDIPTELEIPVGNKFVSPPPNFFCIHCGSTEQEGHIKKEKRTRKHKPQAQRWNCIKFDKKITNDPSPFNYPLWVCYFASFFLAGRMELQAIKNALEMIAWEKQEELSITVSAIHRLLERILEVVLDFEQGIQHPIKSDQWEIDELYIWMSKDGSRPKDKRKRKAWLITVTAIRSRYLLSAGYCDRRSYKNSLKALQIAQSRAKCDPKVIKCDGLPSHTKAARKLFPNAEVSSKSKKESFGHINLLERIHKTIRLGALPKKRRFRSQATTRIYTEIARLDYNFVRSNDATLKTPAQRAYIDFGIKNWRDLLFCAVRFHMRKQFLQERRNRQLKKKSNIKTKRKRKK
ncbi:Uncharacterised protein [uncultured archaeon]|nr:Uncharacterised protein [uncultured archaeon]